MTRELARDTWDEYFHWLSKELLNAPLSIRIDAPPGPKPSEMANLALLTLAYDRRRDVLEVAAVRRTHSASTVSHLVDHPEHVYVDRDVLLAPLTIAIDGRGGGRTVIRLEDEPEPGTA